MALSKQSPRQMIHNLEMQKALAQHQQAAVLQGRARLLFISYLNPPARAPAPQPLESEKA